MDLGLMGLRACTWGLRGLRWGCIGLLGLRADRVLPGLEIYSQCAVLAA